MKIEKNVKKFNRFLNLDIKKIFDFCKNNWGLCIFSIIIIIILPTYTWISITQKTSSQNPIGRVSDSNQIQSGTIDFYYSLTPFENRNFIIKTIESNEQYAVGQILSFSNKEIKFKYKIITSSNSSEERIINLRILGSNNNEYLRLSTGKLTSLDDRDIDSELEYTSQLHTTDNDNLIYSNENLNYNNITYTQIKDIFSKLD